MVYIRVYLKGFLCVYGKMLMWSVDWHWQIIQSEKTAASTEEKYFHKILWQDTDCKQTDTKPKTKTTKYTKIIQLASQHENGQCTAFWF